MKKIALLTSGGDAPGMNAAIRAITRKAIHEGFSVYGIERGFEGIINNEIRPLHARDVGGIITTGGTILRTARYPEFKNLDVQKRAYQITTRLWYRSFNRYWWRWFTSWCRIFDAIRPVNHNNSLYN